VRTSYSRRLFSEKTYNENPLEVAKSFEDAGIQRLHLVDLDGAKQNALSTIKFLKQSPTKPAYISILEEEYSQMK
jgi:phosphoribosylformimino-5-aminoimidazole carboxamide ribonucleotide (ProFAR) isomerase